MRASSVPQPRAIRVQGSILQFCSRHITSNQEHVAANHSVLSCRLPTTKVFVARPIPAEGLPPPTPDRLVSGTRRTLKFSSPCWSRSGWQIRKAQHPAQSVKDEATKGKLVCSN